MNISSLFLVFFFVSLISSCLCSEIDIYATKMILENWNNLSLRSNEEIQKFKVFVPKNRKRKLSNIIPSPILPDEVLNHISSYLEMNSIDALQSFYALNQSSALLLNYYFNPSLVFRESLMNNITHSLISEIFKEIRFDKVDQIYDVILLANIKIIRNEYVHAYLSNHVINLFLAYMKELVFGPNESISTSVEHWKSIFAQNLLVHNLPECTKYYGILINELLIYSKVQIENVEKNTGMILEIVDFLGSKPDKTAISSFKKEVYRNYEFTVIKFAHELHIELLRNVYETSLRQDKTDTYLDKILRNHSFSQILIDRCEDNSTFFKESFLTSIPREFLQPKFMQAIYKKINSLDDKHLLKYLWSRDSSNPFNLEEFIRLNGNINENCSELINQIFSTSNFNLVHIDIFFKLAESGIYNFQEISSESNLNQKSTFQNSLFFSQLLLNLKNISTKMFFSESDLLLHILINSIDLNDMSKIEIYINSIEYDNPLPLIFIECNVLSSFFRLTVDKFNINRRYKFEGKYSNVKVGNEDLNFGDLDGQTLSFKQIVLYFHLTDLFMVFSSTPEDFLSDHDIVDILPPISFSEYLKDKISNE